MPEVSLKILMQAKANNQWVYYSVATQETIISMLSKHISVGTGHIRNGGIGMLMGVGQWRDNLRMQNRVLVGLPELSPLQLQHATALLVLPAPASSIAQLTFIRCWMPTHLPGQKLPLCFHRQGSPCSHVSLPATHSLLMSFPWLSVLTALNHLINPSF